MRKPRVIGISKSPNHCVFVFGKNYSCIEGVLGFLLGLGFMKHETAKLLEPLGSVEDNYSSKKYSKILYNDLYFVFQNDEYSIEVFTGALRIYVSVFTKQDRQTKLTVRF